ncbi:MAG: branched-chain amino acid ABC transporter permease, partial [Geminicoccaceae bacterium]
VLIIRPFGLLGRPEALARSTPGTIEAPLRSAGPTALTLGLCLLGALVFLPLVVGDFVIVLATDILIFALFAASLHFIMGPGGMVSFGHAAYFGLGAYGAALVVKYLGADMTLGLVAAPLAAGLGAFIFGWFCVRLSGVYLAMLTLAAAQIVWSIAFQWRDVTGGDDGTLGIWPAAWASDNVSYYYLTLALCVGGIYWLRRMVHAPFGYGLRAVRDSAIRSAAIGIDQQRQQWLAFIVAGIFAGVAGGLYAFSKGSVFPDFLAIPRSIDGLIMVLLGGVQALSGPIVGAAAFTLLEDQIARFDYWRLILGLVILTIVTLAPDGLSGLARRTVLTLGWSKTSEVSG